MKKDKNLTSKKHALLPIDDFPRLRTSSIRAILYIRERKEEVNSMATYEAGEQAGKGKYACTNCAHIVELKREDEQLPPCPKCNNKTYKEFI